MKRFALLCLWLAACEPHREPDCETIAVACHPLDHGAGPAHDCHVFAEDPNTSGAMCTARLNDCLEVCPADAGRPADATSDASHSDASGG